MYILSSLIGSDDRNNTITFNLNSNSTNTFNISTNQNLSSGVVLYINLSTVYAPPSTATLLTTNVQIQSNGYQKAFGSYDISAIANTITQFDVVPGSQTIGISNTYQLWYVNPDPLTPSSMIRVTIPT